MSTEVKKPNHLRGTLLALGGPIVGVALWLAIWEMGFIASLAAFAMAWLTIWLYKKGAGSVDRNSIIIIIALIVIGLLVSFYASFTADSLQYLLDNEKEARNAGAWTVLTSGNFWSYNNASLTDSTVVGQYTGDFAFAVLLAGLGVFSEIKLLIKGDAKKEEATKDEKAAA